MNKFFDPKFWRYRLERSNWNWLISVQACDWLQVEKYQPAILQEFLEGRILDVGCGFGRIIPYLPDNVTDYVGIDISPDFIGEARKRFPDYNFILKDIRNYEFKEKEFDWAVVIGMACDPTIDGYEEWKKIKKRVLRFAKKMLVLWCSKPQEYKIYQS